MTRPGWRGAAFRHSVAGYLSLRIVLLLAVGLVLRLLGMHGLLLVVAALAVSGVLSYPLARRQRDEMVRNAQDGRRRP